MEAMKYLGAILLVGFIGMAIFGLLQFGHADDAPMVNCPYAEGGFALCDNSLGHINNWQQFLNVIFPTILVLALAVAVIYFTPDFNPPKYFYRYKFDFRPKFAYSQNITKWLALHENSPTF